MSHTHNEYWEKNLTALAKYHDQTHVDIYSLTFGISNLNSCLSSLESLHTTITQLTSNCQQCQDKMNTLTSLFKPIPYPFSYSTPYNPDGPKSSQSTYFPPHHFQQDSCPPHMEVNKFDGSDPKGWVSQMEQYFSLYDITDDLDKLRYDVLHLDPEHWK
jgi:hypothetical protein